MLCCLEKKIHYKPKHKTERCEHPNDPKIDLFTNMGSVPSTPAHVGSPGLA